MSIFRDVKPDKYYEKEIKLELEHRFGYPINYMEKIFSSFDRWRVYSVVGQMIEITNYWAFHLSGGLSERQDRIYFAPRQEINVTTNDFNGNWVSPYDLDEPKTNVSKNKKLNKLKLLYWSYFIKNREKAF